MPAQPLRVSHFEGSAPTAGEKINPRKLIQRVIVRNVDGANTLGISFNGGRSYFSIPPGESLEEDILAHFLYIRGEGGAASYEMMLLG